MLCNYCIFRHQNMSAQIHYTCLERGMFVEFIRHLCISSANGKNWTHLLADTVAMMKANLQDETRRTVKTRENMQNDHCVK